LHAGGEAVAIEFAVKAPGVRDIVICGHSHCGAMAGLLSPETLNDLPAVRSWLSYADSTRRIMRKNYEHIFEADARLTATVEGNVLVQLEHLRTHSSVAVALARKQLNIHGWVYKFETGQVFAYHPIRGQYVLIEGSFLLDLDERDMASILRRTLDCVVARGVLPAERRDEVEAGLLEREQQSESRRSHDDREEQWRTLRRS